MDRYFAAYGKVTIFFCFPDARVWGKHSAWQSTAIGGAHLAPSLRSRRDNIGQKPEPTYLFFAAMKTDCYFESEEGKKAFAEWMEKKNALQNEKLVAQSKKDGE